MTAFVESFLSLLHGSLGARTHVPQVWQQAPLFTEPSQEEKNQCEFCQVSHVPQSVSISALESLKISYWGHSRASLWPCFLAEAGLGMSCFCCSLTSLFCNLRETRDTSQLEPSFCWLAPRVLVLIRKHHSPRQTLANWTLFQNLLIYIAHGTFCGTCCSVE